VLISAMLIRAVLIGAGALLGRWRRSPHHR
jgi:hypothetical protein